MCFPATACIEPDSVAELHVRRRRMSSDINIIQIFRNFFCSSKTCSCICSYFLVVMAAEGRSRASKLSEFPSWSDDADA